FHSSERELRRHKRKGSMVGDTKIQHPLCTLCNDTKYDYYFNNEALVEHCYQSLIALLRSSEQKFCQNGFSISLLQIHNSFIANCCIALELAASQWLPLAGLINTVQLAILEMTVSVTL